MRALTRKEMNKKKTQHIWIHYISMAIVGIHMLNVQIRAVAYHFTVSETMVQSIFPTDCHILLRYCIHRKMNICTQTLFGWGYCSRSDSYRRISYEQLESLTPSMKNDLNIENISWSIVFVCVCVSFFRTNFEILYIYYSKHSLIEATKTEIGEA